jgi:hypothetical protein
VGGFWVSSIAQNETDQTKSEDVAARVSPGIPSKIGGDEEKFQYQEGFIGPIGALPSASNPAPPGDASTPFTVKEALPWQVMHEDRARNLDSMTEFPTRMSSPVLSMKSVCDALRQ